MRVSLNPKKPRTLFLHRLWDSLFLRVLPICIAMPWIRIRFQIHLSTFLHDITDFLRSDPCHFHLLPNGVDKRPPYQLVQLQWNIVFFSYLGLQTTLSVVRVAARSFSGFDGDRVFRRPDFASIFTRDKGFYQYSIKCHVGNVGKATLTTCLQNSLKRLVKICQHVLIVQLILV